MSQPYEQTERSSGVYTATLLDEDGAAVTALDTLVVWLRDVASGTIINSRNGQSLLNANGGTFSAGVLTWEMSPADHAIVGTRTHERHEAEFSAVWDSGAKRKTWKVQWLVTNLRSVTS
jgi:hypothetical protein